VDAWNRQIVDGTDTLSQRRIGRGERGSVRQGPESLFAVGESENIREALFLPMPDMVLAAADCTCLDRFFACEHVFEALRHAKALDWQHRSAKPSHHRSQLSSDATLIGQLREPLAEGSRLEYEQLIAFSAVRRFISDLDEAHDEWRWQP
jgi:hypothetical protein